MNSFYSTVCLQFTLKHIAIACVLLGAVFIKAESKTASIPFDQTSIDLIFDKIVGNDVDLTVLKDVCLKLVEPYTMENKRHLIPTLHEELDNRTIKLRSNSVIKISENGIIDEPELRKRKLSIDEKTPFLPNSTQSSDSSKRREESNFKIQDFPLPAGLPNHRYQRQLSGTQIRPPPVSNGLNPMATMTGMPPVSQMMSSNHPSGSGSSLRTDHQSKTVSQITANIETVSSTEHSNAEDSVHGEGGFSSSYGGYQNTPSVAGSPSFDHFAPLGSNVQYNGVMNEIPISTLQPAGGYDYGKKNK